MLAPHSLKTPALYEPKLSVLQSVIFMLMYVNVFFSFIFSYILLEMVETERDYVRDLGALVEVGLYSVLLTNTAVRSLW